MGSLRGSRCGGIWINDADEIFRAFKPYSDKTELEELSDPEALEPLKHELGQPQVYHWSEIEALARVLYKSADTQRAARPRTDRAPFAARGGPV